MKVTPFKTLRTSPFMQADPGLSGSQIPIDPNTGSVAPQMQDTDPYKGKAALYSSELDYATTEYGSSSLEDINAVMEEAGVNPYELNAEQVFDYSGNKMGDYSILGDDGEFNEGRSISTSKGVSNKVFQYGNIKSVKQDDGSFIETISITAKNHPLYGNTYTRTKTENKERGTLKPVEDFNSVLSNYSYGNQDATVGILGISIKDGKANWHFNAEGNFEEAIEKGWLKQKDGSKLSEKQIAELISEFKKASNRFKGSMVTSTKLNKK